MKKGLRITFRVLAVLLLLLLALVVAVESPAVQTYLARKAVERFAGNIDADIEVGGVTVKPFDALVLRNVVVKDRHPYRGGLLPAQDTLLSVGTLSARFSLKGLLHKERISVSRLRLEGGSFNLVTEPGAPGEKATSNLSRILGLKPSGEPKKDFGDLLEASRVDIEGFRFRMLNHPAAQRKADEGREPVSDHVIDWDDLDVVADIHASDLLVKDGEIIGNADHIRIAEKCGWNVHDLSGKVKAGHGQVLLDKLHIQDDDSDLHLRYLRLLGPLDDYGDFLRKVRLEGEFAAPTVFSMQTVSHFSPNLEEYTFKAEMAGKVDGTVENFHVKGLSFNELGSGVSGKVEGSMNGLPDINTTRMDFKVKDFLFTTDGIATFIREWSPATELDLSQIAKGTNLRLDATAKGTLNRLAVQGCLDTSAGAADVDLTLRNILDRSRDIAIGGTARTRNLDAGRIAGIDALGPVTLETGLEAVLAKGNPQVRIDSLKVSGLRALGYDYTGIEAAGTYSGQAFDGRIVCNDPNLNFLLQGTFDLAPKTRNAAYRFYANVGYADLNALHLDKRGPSKVSLQADANFIRTRDRDLLGEVNLRDVVLENAAGRYEVGDVTASAHANDDIHRIRFNADFAEGTFVGGKSALDMVADLKELLVRRELPSLLTDSEKPWDGSPYEANFKFYDTQKLLGFLLPGLYIEKNTDLKLKVDGDGLVTGGITSGRLALQDKYVKDFKLDFDNRDGALHAGISGGAVRAGDFEILLGRLNLTADDDQFGANFVFDNGDEVLSRGDLRLEGRLDRDARGLTVTAGALPSSIYYNGEKWDIDSEDVTVCGGDIRIGQLRLSNGPQELLADGGLSSSKADTLSVRLDRFDISLLNSFLMKGKMDLKGKATGRARLVSPTQPSVGLLAGITCDSTYIAGRPVGRLLMRSGWDEENQRFDFRIRNEQDGVRNIDLDGFLNPKDKSVRADATLSKLDLGYAAPILAGIFNEFGGGLDGKIHVGGTLDKLEISSEGTQIVDGSLGIDFTQVTYGISGPVSVDTEGLHFTRVALTDGVGGKGNVTGSLLFGGFKDPCLDTHVRFDQMKVLGIPAGRKSPISGTVYGTGKVDVTGTFDAVRLDVDARTVKSGDLHIPLGSGSAKATGDLLVFTEPEVPVEEDPYETLMQAGRTGSKKKSKSDLDIRVKVSATPAVTAYVDIGENSLRGLGNGLIDLRVRESQNLFTINGDYTLSQGDFHFSTLGIVNREFSIQDGSSIRFRGDVMESELDVTGIYSTKADISNLLSGSLSEEGSSRRQVNCLIGITDKLRNPQVKFDIEVPELDPGTEGLVESALNTDDKKMKQFLYLLIANSFLPNEDSGIITTGSTNMLYSNMTGIMAGQLNSIFQKLDIPLDLGLNYQQGTAGNNIFDVALSTQLFNNRVVVNGTIGNRRLFGTTTDEMAGDIDIDIKLDKPGTIRLNLFSHSADQYTSYLDNSQRNGVGIAYQREFNSFRQLVQDVFSTREQREEQAAQEALQPARRRILQIDSTGKAHPIVTNE
ncbi:MAG: translocation/assembly module TamB domain-containing protein [Bacteroidales bacterium]|nr:translocation/assembly module TamB domain-containing protein [Bacteroidales bacterium]